MNFGKTNPNPDPNLYRRHCPDPNARIQKFGKDCVSYSSYYPFMFVSKCFSMRSRAYAIFHDNVASQRFKGSGHFGPRHFRV